MSAMRMTAVDRGLSTLVAVLMGVLVLDVAWQVVTRYVLGSPSSYTEEVARYLLIWIGLLGSATAYRQSMHLSFDLLATKLPPGARLALHRVIHSAVLVFCLVVLVYGGIQLVSITWELRQVSASLGLRLAYVYAVIPVSGMIMGWTAIRFIRHGAEVDSAAADGTGASAAGAEVESNEASGDASDQRKGDA